MILARLWDQFWFRPTTCYAIGLYRIALGLLILQNVAVHFAANFWLCFSRHSMWPIEAMSVVYWHYLPKIDMMLLLPDSDLFRISFMVATCISLIMFTAGIFSNASGFAALLCLMSLQSHCPLLLNSGDTFQRLCLLFTCLAPCGEKLSLDALLKRRKGISTASLHAPWAQRLIQVQLSAVYILTAFFKASGSDWLDGSAVYFATRLTEFYHYPVFGFSDYPIVCKVLSWGTIVTEFALGTIIWIPPCCYFMLALGFIFHLTLDYAFNLPVFEWLFISAYILFIKEEDLIKFGHRLLAQSARLGLFRIKEQSGLESVSVSASAHISSPPSLPEESLQEAKDGSGGGAQENASSASQTEKS